MNLISDEIQSVLYSAEKSAELDGFEFVMLEHLLLALLDNARVSGLLAEREIDQQSIRAELAVFLADAKAANNVTAEGSPNLTTGVKRALATAKAVAGKRPANGIDLLTAFFAVREESSYATYVLKEAGISIERVERPNFFSCKAFLRKLRVATRSLWPASQS